MREKLWIGWMLTALFLAALVAFLLNRGGGDRPGQPCAVAEGTTAGYVPCETAQTKNEVITPPYLTGMDLTEQQKACLVKTPGEHDGCRSKVCKMVIQRERELVRDERGNVVKDENGRETIKLVTREVLDCNRPLNPSVLVPAGAGKPVLRGQTRPPGAPGLLTWLSPVAVSAQDDPDPFTFHNPGVGGFNGSVQMFFREQVYVKNTVNPYYQHAHGRTHSLYVVDRAPGGGAATLNLYTLDLGDVITMVPGPATGPPDFRSTLGTITLLETKDGIVNDSCKHEKEPHDKGPFYQWQVSMNNLSPLTEFPDVFEAPATGDKVGFKTLRGNLKTSGTYIRQLVVRTPSGAVKYQIPLSACGAFQTCARPADGTCNDVPLCRIDLRKMIGTCEECKQRLSRR